MALQDGPKGWPCRIAQKESPTRCGTLWSQTTLRGSGLKISHRPCSIFHWANGSELSDAFISSFLLADHGEEHAGGKRLGDGGEDEVVDARPPAESECPLVSPRAEIGEEKRQETILMAMMKTVVMSLSLFAIVITVCKLSIAITIAFVA